MYCNRSCLCVCGGRAVSKPYYSQRVHSVCISLSAFFHLFVAAASGVKISNFKGLETLPFTSKWGHESPCPELRPANFQLATPFHSRLRVRHGTDRQKDNSHHCMGVSHNSGCCGSGLVPNISAYITSLMSSHQYWYQSTEGNIN